MVGCIPTRLGKVKLINSGEIRKGDSVLFLSPVYTYDPFGSPISGSIWDKHTSRQKVFEEKWDSAQIQAMHDNFKILKLSTNRDLKTYQIRRFKYKVLIGTSRDMKADSISWLLTKFTWHINANQPDSAFHYLPDSILHLSFAKPTAIITNDLFFYDKDFFSGYARGSTGLQMSVDMRCSILKNGKVIYFRTYGKRYHYFKIIDDKEKLISINQKLFDKLKTH